MIKIACLCGLLLLGCDLILGEQGGSVSLEAALEVRVDGKPVTTRVTYRCGFEIRY